MSDKTSTELLDEIADRLIGAGESIKKLIDIEVGKGQIEDVKELLDAKEVDGVKVEENQKLLRGLAAWLSERKEKMLARGMADIDLDSFKKWLDKEKGKDSRKKATLKDIEEYKEHITATYRKRGQ